MAGDRGFRDSILIIVDHANNFIPSKYKNLGLSKNLTESHIAYAPVLDCTTTDDLDNGTGVFVYDISTGDSNQVPATATGITKDFVTLSSESEYTTNWGSGPTSPLD